MTPKHVLDIEQALEKAKREKTVAVKNQNFELGAEFRDTENELTEKLKMAKHFYQLVYDGAKMRYENIGEDIEKRLNFELQVINNKKWEKYFLLLCDMLDTIRKKGAIVGPGSMPSSLVAYCLRITDIDPIAYDLLFERFADTQSESFPFSVYVDSEGKNEAIRFLRKKGIIKKADYSDYYPDGSDMISTTIFGETEFDIYLTEVKSLSIIRKIVEIHHKDAHVDIDIESIPNDDPVVYRKFANGEASGLLGFENADMEELCLRLFRPSNIEDLAAIYSLNANSHCRIEMIAKLIDGKHGYEKVKYEIPELEKHLKNTYGVTIYQEQVMNISQDLAGFSPCQSNELRKTLGKRLTDKLNDIREMFLEGCSATGYDKNKVVEIYNSWVDYALFCNKSTAISVALIAYRMAWLKAYYPTIWHFALMK